MWVSRAMTWDHSVETYRVDRVRHRVERPDGERELVEDEVVGVVLLPNQPAKPLLVDGSGDQARLPMSAPGRPSEERRERGRGERGAYERSS